jgi:hypothetical protein
MALGMAVVSAIPSQAVQHASGRVICNVQADVTHTTDSVTVTLDPNGNPCHRFFWPWMIGKRNTGQQVQDDGKGIQSGTTTATDPALIANWCGGYKQSGTSGVVIVKETYSSSHC